MKPLFLKLHQDTTEIAVNMNQIAYISPNLPKGSVLYFAVWTEGEPLYIVVDETVDEIGNRQEWRS